MNVKLSHNKEYEEKWLSVVNSNLNGFIQDHADCERRSSSTALGILAKHPEKHRINDELIKLSIVKLQRFHQLYNFMYLRQIELPREMSFDLYGKQLGWLIKSGKEDRLLDRLLIAGIVEAREQQRLQVAHHSFQDNSIKVFYGKLLVNDNPYFNLCAECFQPLTAHARLEELLEKEAEILHNLELRAALH